MPGSSAPGAQAGVSPRRRSSVGGGRTLAWIAAALLVALVAYANRSRTAEIAPFVTRDQRTPAAATASVPIEGTDLTVGVPTGWQRGGVMGPTVVVSLIGSPDGYPAFSVQTDPDGEARLPLRPAAARAALEGLQAALDQGRRVEFARWVAVNGIDALSSRTTFPSPAGEITVRRLLLQRHGQPYIFTWSARSRDYAALEALVEACVRSLRRQDR